MCNVLQLPGECLAPPYKKIILSWRYLNHAGVYFVNIPGAGYPAVELLVGDNFHSMAFRVRELLIYLQRGLEIGVYSAKRAVNL